MQKLRKYIWTTIVIIAVFALSYILMDNLILSLNSNELTLSAVSFTILVVFLFKQFKK